MMTVGRFIVSKVIHINAEKRWAEGLRVVYSGGSGSDPERMFLVQQKHFARAKMAYWPIPCDI